jgi:hypothetical protein
VQVQAEQMPMPSMDGQGTESGETAK